MAEDPALTQLATRLFAMARRGDAETLAAYLDAGVPCNLANDQGDTLLMLAAYHGHPQTAARLLDRGADPDRLNDRGQSPLAGAVFKGETAVVALLASRGADPHTGTPTATQAAHMFHQPHMLALLRGETPH